MEVAPFFPQNGGTGVCLGIKLSDFKYAHDVVPLTENLDKLQLILDHRNNSGCVWGTFCKFKAQMPLQDWTDWTRNFTLSREDLCEKGRSHLTK